MAKRKTTILVPILVVISGVASGAVLSMPAWRDYQKEALKAKQRVADAQVQERKLADSIRKDAETQTAIGREAQVRALGKLKPDEVPLPLPSNFKP